MSDSTTTIDQTEAPHRTRVREHAFHALVAAGMHPDRSLLGMLGLSSIREEKGVMVVPSNFTAKVRQAKPHLFVDLVAGTNFDARTASAAEVDKRLADMVRADFRRRQDAASARTMADLRARYELSS